MTIKELEGRTGMARANIRYYEEEGLLRPRRLANGYRDYSEEDAATLEKIKLLRTLQMDIGTIRLVQQGQLTLEQAVFSQLNRLEGDRVFLERAVEVCREIQRSGIEYGALDPQPLLRELEAPARPRMTPPPQTIHFPTLEEELDREHQACYHPWMRLLARGVDWSLYHVLISALAALVFRVNLLRTSALGEWFMGLAALIFMCLVEPLWLHSWGWTPGKWIFGLKVRRADGGKLSLPEAWSRSWRVFSRGYGFYIPLYNLWRLWKCYRCCKDMEDCPWDYGEERRYTKEDRPLSWLMWLGAQAACIFLVVVVLLQSYLPPHRGELTAAEFGENYNYYVRFFGLQGQDTLDAQGNWVDPYAQSDGVIITWEGDAPAQWDRSVTFETAADGAVTAVTLTEEVEGAQLLSVDPVRPQLATAALAGAQGAFHCFNLDLNGWLALWQDRWDSFETEHRGIRVSQQIESSGYHKGLIWTAIDGQEQFYRRTVTISLMGSETA